MSETLKMVLIFLSGCWVGCFIGILVLSLCRAAKQADEDMINK
jgi:NhaP-type Na+/H+ or K+/H+ antiporter